MKRSIRLDRLLLAGVVAALAIPLFAQLAYAGPPAPSVPSDIAVEDGHKVFLVGHAVGHQIWTCDATPSGYRWAFVGPRADVFDDNGKLLMTHFAGPKWRTIDGSEVVGQRVNGITVDPTAIPWLLLSAKPTAGSPEDGRLAATTFIQRIATVGGLEPPAAACNESTVGITNEVPYTADYYFWKRK